MSAQEHPQPLLAVMSDPAVTDRYDFGDCIGKGAMGVVYFAIQKGLQRPVAIKCINAQLLQNQEFRERFLTEARLAAGLIHANLTAVYDYGMSGDVPYLVTEFVEGDSLQAMLEEGRLSYNQIIPIIQQILHGLTAIHDLGIVHRDIKPGNIQVKRGQPLHIKILDFGLAKEARPTGPEITADGAVVGTPEYMSPEQIVGDVITPQADLYSLTIIIYELILGHPTFLANSCSTLTQQHLSADPVIPVELLPSVQEFLARGLAKDPVDRYRNATEYLQAWDDLAQEVVLKESFFSVPGYSGLERPPGETQTAISGRVARGGISTDPSRRRSHGKEAARARSLLRPLTRHPLKATMLALVGLFVGLGLLTRSQAGRVPAPNKKQLSRKSADWLTRLNQVEGLARRGKIVEAGDVISALLRYDYTGFKEQGVTECVESDLAQGVDNALAIILSDGLAGAASSPCGPNAKFRPEIVDGRLKSPGSVGPFLSQLIPMLACDKFGYAKDLLSAFLKPRDGTVMLPLTESILMHRYNALRWLRSSVSMGMPLTLANLVIHYGEMGQILRTHPEHPIGAWSANLLREIMRSLGDTKAAEALREREIQIWARSKMRPTDARWAPAARLVAKNRDALKLNLLEMGQNPVFMEKLRSGILLMEVVVRVFDGYRSDGDLSVLVDSLPPERQAAAREVWRLLGAAPVQWDVPVDPALLLRLANIAGLDGLPLVDWARARAQSHLP